jgi:hypothetical protein
MVPGGTKKKNDAGRSKVVQMCSMVSKGVLRCPKVPKSVQRSTKVYQCNVKKLCEGVQRCATIPIGVQRLPKFPKGTQSCTAAPNGTQRFLEKRQARSKLSRARTSRHKQTAFLLIVPDASFPLGAEPSDSEVGVFFSLLP